MIASTGFTLILAVFADIAESTQLVPDLSPIGAVTVLLIVASLFGAIQWLILRRYVPIDGWWVVASAVGWAMGFSAALFILFIFVFDSKSLAAVGFGVVGGGLIGGAVLGTSQWLVLRRYVPRAGYWILASAVALIVALAGGAVRFDFDMVAGLLLGVSYGTITATALVLLLRQPAREGEFPASSTS